jgi:glycosyltransferase involved in cell wall biosynthesis
LEAFVTPWFPGRVEMACLRLLPSVRLNAARLGRRRFEPLSHAPKIQGRLGEWRRLWRRQRGTGDEGLSYEANDWLMQAMARECRRKAVTAVHAYEDCSLTQFDQAKRLGKACIYDMPIGYYPAWEQTQAELFRKFEDWLPSGGLSSKSWVRPEQKRREMELADLVLAPSAFVRETILRFHPDKKILLAPYGVDLEFWKARTGGSSSGLRPASSESLRFIYAGQCSIRKGTPVLFGAWRKAGLHDATLSLAGSWQLAEAPRMDLPAGVKLHGPVSSELLRQAFSEADVFVCPSFFEGRMLAVGEALACGLPVITTAASGMMDILDEACSRIVPAGNEDALVEALRWFAENRDRLPAMKSAARAKAETCTWANYRQCVVNAVAALA